MANGTQSVSSFAIFYSHAFIDGFVTIDMQKKFHEKNAINSVKNLIILFGIGKIPSAHVLHILKYIAEIPDINSA